MHKKNNLKLTEKIIRYADGLMNNSEKTSFERELAQSEELQKKLKLYHNLSSEVKKIKNVQTDESYFAAVLPEFRIKQENQRRLKLIPGLALGAVLAAAVILFFTIPKSEVAEVEPNNSFVTLSEMEIDSLVNNYPDYTNDFNPDEMNENYTEYVDEIFIDEMNISAQSFDSLVLYSSYSSYLDLISEVNDEEADLIYKQVINKELF